MSIKIKLISILTVTIFTVSVLLAINSIYSIKKVSADNIEKFQEKAYQEKKEELENYSEIAKKVIASYYEKSSKDKIEEEMQTYIDEQLDFLFSIINKQYEQYKDTLSDNDLKILIINTVASTRYRKSGYFWINDLSATETPAKTHPHNLPSPNKFSTTSILLA